MKNFPQPIATSAIVLSIVLMSVPAITLAAPNTGSGPQKTDKQCKDERDTCNKACDKLIDIDNNVKNCKDRCTDGYVICTPMRGAMPPGNKFGAVRPYALPKQNAPIMRRGVEGEPSAPSSTESDNLGK